MIAGRFVVRPPASPAPADRRLENIVIDRGRAFGSGLHPTTQRCLELLLALRPGGSFADLGCGTGVLAIGAARLGWGPVVAVDYDEGSVAATAWNAELNGVQVAARRADLLAEAPPPAQTLVANVPAQVHAAVRGQLTETPCQLIVSGVTPAAADEVVAAYADLGLSERHRVIESDWAAVSSPPTASSSPNASIRCGPLPHPILRRRRRRTRCRWTLPGQLGRACRTGGSRSPPPATFRPAPGWPCSSRPACFDSTSAISRTRSSLDPNLAGVPIRSLPGLGPPRTVLTTDDLTLDDPWRRTRGSLRIGRRTADVVLTALSGSERWLGSVTAQAIIGPPPREERPGA